MSYEKKVSEEMHIHVVDDATKLAAKMLGYYIDNFYTMYQISHLDIFDASLTVDGETITIKRIENIDGKVFHEATRGKNKGKMVPLNSKPSVYYAFRQWARELHEATDISFTIYYEAYRYMGDDVGIDCMITALKGLNCASVRKNVTYKGMEEYDFTDGITVFRFDKDFQGYVESTDDISIIRDADYWEFNFNSDIAFNGGEDDPFDLPESIREIIEKLRPFTDKYSIEIEEYNDGDENIGLSGYVFIPSDKLDHFLSDYDEFLAIIDSYRLDIAGFSDHLISRDYGKFAVIRFGLNEDGKMKRTFIRI